MGAPEHRLVNDDINDSTTYCTLTPFALTRSILSWAEKGQTTPPRPVGYISASTPRLFRPSRSRVPCSLPTGCAPISDCLPGSSSAVATDPGHQLTILHLRLRLYLAGGLCASPHLQDGKTMIYEGILKCRRHAHRARILPGLCRHSAACRLGRGRLPEMVVKDRRAAQTAQCSTAGVFCPKNHLSSITRYARDTELQIDPRCGICSVTLNPEPVLVL